MKQSYWLHQDCFELCLQNFTDFKNGSKTLKLYDGTIECEFGTFPKYVHTVTVEPNGNVNIEVSINNTNQPIQPLNLSQLIEKFKDVVPFDKLGININ